MRSTVLRRAVVPAIALAFGTLAVLGLLIGPVGASRAYAVGVHTLYADHLASVVITAAIGFIGGILVGRAFTRQRELWVAIATVVATDVAATLLVTVAIPEMARHPEILRAIVAESAGGLQIGAIVFGLVIGRLATGRSSEWSVER